MLLGMNTQMKMEKIYLFQMPVLQKKHLLSDVWGLCFSHAVPEPGE